MEYILANKSLNISSQYTINNISQRLKQMKIIDSFNKTN